MTRDHPESAAPGGTMPDCPRVLRDIHSIMTEQAADRITLCQLAPDVLRMLLESPPGSPTNPRLSLTMPTHRSVPDNRVDLPVYHHLVATLERTLAANHAPHAVTRLLEPFRLLAGDRRFWQHARDGLALFAHDGQARAFLLQRPVPPLALVTPRFHLLPLLRLAASLERFHVLALTSRTAAVSEGTAWHDARGDTAGPLDPLVLTHRKGSTLVPCPGIDRGDVVDEEVFQPHRVQRGMGIEGIVHGGVGSKDDDVDADTEIFLRHVDATVHEQVSRPAGLPLVLVALPRLGAMFRRVAKNPWLVEEPVAADPHLMSSETVAAAVLPVFAAARERRIARELRAFAVARDRDLASDEFSAVARAAVAGRVARLLIETDRFEPGRLDRDTGAITRGGPAPLDPWRSGDLVPAGDEDLFAAVAETVVLHRGDVVALARSAMPTESGVAAVYRY